MNNQNQNLTSGADLQSALSSVANAEIKEWKEAADASDLKFEPVNDHGSNVRPVENMVSALKRILEESTPEQKAKWKKDLAGPEIPKGWVSINDHLPKMLAIDFMSGTMYKVRYENGSEGESIVGDHSIWEIFAKEEGIVEWWNDRF